MAQDESITSDVAAVDRPEDAQATISPPARKRKKSDDEDDFGYDVDFETPFGKIEFALEPSSVKERKDEERREKAEKDQAKAVARAAKKAEKQMKKDDRQQQIIIREGGSKLVPILLIFLLVAGAVALAIWLFARPGEAEQDAIPVEFLNDDAQPAPVPQGFAAVAQSRIRNAVRAGRQASRDAQAEQDRKFQDLTGKK